MQVKRFKDTTGNAEFYALMGKYFAESKYKKEIPYMSNQKGDVWFVAMDNGTVMRFVSVGETNSKIVLKHDYVEEEYRQNKVFTRLNKERMDYVDKIKKPMEVAVKEQCLIAYWTKRGFKGFRESGSYTYLRKDV